MTVLAWVWQSMIGFGFGIGSAVVPVLNAEAYVVGAGVSRALDPMVAALGLAVGQTVGKLGMFAAVRYRPGYGEAHLRPEPAGLDLSTWRGRSRQWIRDTGKRMLDLLGAGRYGIPVTVASSFTGIPPLYAVALIAGASRMRIAVFAVAVLAGRIARFVMIALGVSAV